MVLGATKLLNHCVIVMLVRRCSTLYVGRILVATCFRGSDLYVVRILRAHQHYIVYIALGIPRALAHAFSSFAYLKHYKLFLGQLLGLW